MRAWIFSKWGSPSIRLLDKVTAKVAAPLTTRNLCVLQKTQLMAFALCAWKCVTRKSCFIMQKIMKMHSNTCNLMQGSFWDCVHLLQVLVNPKNVWWEWWHTQTLASWSSFGLVGSVHALMWCCHHSRSLSKEAGQAGHFWSFRHCFKSWLPPSSMATVVTCSDSGFAILCGDGWAHLDTETMQLPPWIVVQRSRDTCHASILHLHPGPTALWHKLMLNQVLAPG